jgi:DNA-binding transcriptional MerR regulator
MTGDSEMTISALARESGVTPRTIRYYTSKGLLPAPAGSGQYRIYGREHLILLGLIKRLKSEYLPLEVIHDALRTVEIDEMERILDSGVSPLKRSNSDSFLLDLLDSISDEGSEESSDGFTPASNETPDSRKTDTNPTRTGAIALPWHRVTLVDGIELHYRSTSNPKKSKLVQDVVSLAMKLIQGEK